MIYQAFEAQAALYEWMRPLASAAATTLRLPWPELPWPELPWTGVIPHALGSLAATLDTFAAWRVTSRRPGFRIEPVLVGNELVPVEEEVVAATPFTHLVHFRKAVAAPQPRVLLVAPMSGHFATLLRGTIQTLLIDHDVYVTDWQNIRDVPAEAGSFGLAAYVDEIIACLQVLGEGTHLVAVCQPVVPALAATALMAETDEAARPASLTLMAGPIDARINPTMVNKLAAEKAISWFESKLIDRVPAGYRGAGRRVYPGFVQLTAFMSMNVERHRQAFEAMARALADGDLARHDQIKAFYDEYLAVMDLAADFYLETVRLVFQEHALAQGQLSLNGRRIDPKAIRRIALLTVEGERDDICGLGQTMAAQELCTNVRQYRRMHHVQTGVGHYGVFSGRRWAAEIYPKVRDTIALAS